VNKKEKRKDRKIEIKRTKELSKKEEGRKEGRKCVNEWPLTR
jgi:hypothetical protein